MLRSFELLRNCTVLALLAGLALSPKLWLSSRLYPLTPVWPFLGPLTPPVDRIAYFALIALLIASMAAPRRAILAAVCALLLLAALQDQSRWQPWFYQYVLMLLAILLAGSSRHKATWNTCRLIVAATYIWSGLSKLNPDFLRETFPWLLGPFAGVWPAPAHWLAGHLALAAPLVECAAGVGLLTRRFRRGALYLAIAMHAFILMALGPLGLNFNPVVWPWNLAMIAFLLILFSRRADEPSPREIIWGGGFAFQRIVLVLFAFMPILCFFHLWDDYLSSALYSGNTDDGTIYFNDDAYNRLPSQIQDFVTTDGPDRNELDIDDWAFGELRVPPNPEIRIYRSVARRICAYTANGPSVKLVVQGKFALANGNRTSVYRCADLRRGF